MQSMSPRKSIRITRIRLVGFPLAIVVVVLSVFLSSRTDRHPGALPRAGLVAWSLAAPRRIACGTEPPRLFAHAMSPPAGKLTTTGAASALRATDCIASG
ncbi:hypothetical protein [Burkholderia territorii]|uniref:hypothetical protein n=1 Tax=Burkholderia territorii TaxID=1503055 RepID=UPI001E2D200C|nr:hypothetical protein [Burkholderia territorii]